MVHTGRVTIPKEKIDPDRITEDFSDVSVLEYLISGSILQQIFFEVVIMLTGILAGFLAAFLQSSTYVLSKIFILKHQKPILLTAFS